MKHYLISVEKLSYGAETIGGSSHKITAGEWRENVRINKIKYMARKLVKSYFQKMRMTSKKCRKKKLIKSYIKLSEKMEKVNNCVEN